MGIIPATAGSHRASGAGDGFAFPAAGLRDHAGQPNRRWNGNSAGGNDRLLAQEAHGRQRAALAQLVGTLEPSGAENLAEQLLLRFGSIGEVFAAPPKELERVTGNHTLAAMLTFARTAVVEGLRENVRRTRFDLRDPPLLKYLTALFQAEQQEHLHVIFLDSQGRYTSEERLASGDWSRVTLRLRPLIQRALDLSAASIVLVHNHPSGVAQPSPADIEFTTEVQKIGRVLGIAVHDHLIVAGAAVFSMRAAGLLKGVRK